MNTDLDTYFKEHNFSVYNSAEDEECYYNPHDEIHESATYNYRKLVDTNDDRSPSNETATVKVTKSTFFGKHPYSYYIIYVSHYGPFGSGHGSYEETLADNEELTVEHIETVCKLLNIPFD